MAEVAGQCFFRSNNRLIPVHGRTIQERKMELAPCGDIPAGVLAGGNRRNASETRAGVPLHAAAAERSEKFNGRMPAAGDIMRCDGGDERTVALIESAAGDVSAALEMLGELMGRTSINQLAANPVLLKTILTKVKPEQADAMKLALLKLCLEKGDSRILRQLKEPDFIAAFIQEFKGVEGKQAEIIACITALRELRATDQLYELVAPGAETAVGEAHRKEVYTALGLIGARERLMDLLILEAHTGGGNIETVAEMLKNQNFTHELVAAIQRTENQQSKLKVFKILRPVLSHQTLDDLLALALSQSGIIAYSTAHAFASSPESLFRGKEYIAKDFDTRENYQAFRHLLTDRGNDIMRIFNEGSEAAVIGAIRGASEGTEITEAGTFSRMGLLANKLPLLDTLIAKGYAKALQAYVTRLNLRGAEDELVHILAIGARRTRDEKWVIEILAGTVQPFEFEGGEKVRLLPNCKT